ncbi:queuosine salvage protein [Tetranychus urticae]|uniref:Queuosine 5'-phosphate N-glycosylase/hydrolase n=1 Tax=Tetranychus urticae TaxID=32264 RepID=T1KFL3_TETUR|nr:queuosine salvage protein [Tetranychus urticae]
MPNKVINPKETAEFLAKISKNVHINYEGVHRMATEIYTALIRGEYTLGMWREHELHPKEPTDFAVNWIFLVDSLNFSFWPDEDKEFGVTYKDIEYTGYWALCAIINRALDQGIPMCNPDYYSNLSLDQVKRIFAAHRKGKPNEPMDLPLLEERHAIMRENGSVLVKKFSNTFVSMVIKAKNSAKTLLKMVHEYFPSFRDELLYNGESIGFYKRAQLLIGDIYACHEGKGLGKFDDIQDITMFADYRVPQCLYYLGVINYRDELLRRLSAGEKFKYGDPDEVEIRGVSIHAVEQIKNGVVRLAEINNVTLPIPATSVIVDFYLWDLRRSRPDEIDECITYHKTRSIHY